METTTDFLRWQGGRIADQATEEANHLYHKWGHDDGTADMLKELSTIAADLGGRFHKIAGDALDMAERLDPTPIGFTEVDVNRARLRLVKAEEYAAETQEFVIDDVGAS